MLATASKSIAAPISRPGESDKAARQHIRGSALLLVGRFVSLGLNLATQVLTVRYLSKHDYGAFAYALSMVSLASSLSVFGLDKTSARFVSIYSERHEHAKIAGTLLVVGGIIFAVGAAIVLTVVGFSGLIGLSLVSSPLSLALLLTLIVLAPVQALDSVLVSLFSVFVGAKAIFFRRHILAPGLQFAAVLLVVFLHGNVQHLAVGYLAAGVIGVVVYTVLFAYVLRERGLLQYFSREKLRLPFREIFGFALPLFASDLALIVRASLAVLCLEYFHSSGAVAEFRSVLPLARLNQVVLQSFTFLFIPITARMLARGDEGEIGDVYWKSVLWITVFSFPIFAVTFALAEPVTVMMFGERYTDSGLILSILAIGFYANAAAGLNSRTLKVYGKLRYVLVIDAIVTVIAISAYLLLVPRYGALGGAVGLCLILILHNLANQIGLRMATGISAFGWRYLKLYATVAAVAAVLWQVLRLSSPPLYVGLAMAAAASLLVLLLNRTQLQVEKTFPELLHVPVLRCLLSSSTRSTANSSTEKKDAHGQRD